jgi:hypothetical protein
LVYICPERCHQNPDDDADVGSRFVKVGDDELKDGGKTEADAGTGEKTKTGKEQGLLIQYYRVRIPGRPMFSVGKVVFLVIPCLRA